MLETIIALTIPLLVAGLAIRLLLGFALGSQDIEFWKSYGHFIRNNGILNIYGASDREIWPLIRQGVPLIERLKQTQARYAYDAISYHRDYFWNPHLPLFIYPIALVARWYRRFSPELANNRFYNFYINLVPTIANLLLTGVIFLAVQSILGTEAGCIAALLYWLSPLVILNSPLLGFMDAPTALFSTASIYFLAHGDLPLAYGALALSVCHKALGVLIAPVVLVVGLKEYSLVDNVVGWGTGAITVLVVTLPYLIAGRGLAVIQGFLSLVSHGQSLSSQALNPWWIVQYRKNVAAAIARGLPEEYSRSGGPDTNWFGDLPADQITVLNGIPAKRVGFLAFLVVTALIAAKLALTPEIPRWELYFAAAIQIYAYVQLRCGVQVNHYFTMIPLLAICAVLNPFTAGLYVLVSVVYLFQDLVFYGLGRDFNPGLDLLSYFQLGRTTIIAAAINATLFLTALAWFLAIA